MFCTQADWESREAWKTAHVLRKHTARERCAQVWDLEETGGSIIGGVLALLRERKANPPPPRDARLPPKPAGQTVGSFRRGLQALPQAIADKLKDHIRCASSLALSRLLPAGAAALPTSSRITPGAPRPWRWALSRLLPDRPRTTIPRSRVLRPVPCDLAA